MSRSLAEIIQSSHDPDAFVVCSTEDPVSSQLSQFRQLMNRRRTASDLQRYLLTYDSCMRLTEALASLHGFRFGSHAHVAFKVVVKFVLPDTDDRELRDLVSDRHLAKKRGLRPSELSTRSLDTLLDDLRRSDAISDLLRLTDL